MNTGPLSPSARNALLQTARENLLPGALNQPVSPQELNQILKTMTQEYAGKGNSKTPWIDHVMAGFTDANTIAHTSLEDKKKFMESLQAGKEAAKNSTPADRAADLAYGNTNPPGEHDSRSMALINSNPANAQQFANATPAEKQRYLFEADFYWKGVDTYDHQHQITPATLTPAGPTVPPSVPVTPTPSGTA